MDKDIESRMLFGESVAELLLACSDLLFKERPAAAERDARTGGRVVVHFEVPLPGGRDGLTTEFDVPYNVPIWGSLRRESTRLASAGVFS